MHPKKTIIGTVLITCIVILLIMFLIKPKYDESFYKKYKDELLIKENQSKAVVDSLINVKLTDSLALVDSLIAKNQELLILKDKYSNALTIIRNHEKALNKYRNSNVDDRFGTFTELISSQDSIPRE